MIKTVVWIVIVLAALITTLGFAAGHKSAGVPAPVAKNGILPPCPNKPNCVSTEVQHDSAAYIPPIAITKADVLNDDSNHDSNHGSSNAQKHLLATAQAQLESLGGRVTGVDGNTIKAEFQSRLFRFIDDVLLQIDAKENVYRIRSSSRVGHSDAGANRKRVEAIRQLVNKSN